MLYQTLKGHYKERLLDDPDLFKEFALRLAKTQNKKWEFGSLEYRFIDSKGQKYYGFPNSLEIPKNRYLAMLKYARFLQNNLTPENIGEICDKINKLLEEGVLRMSKGKRTNMIKIGALVSELKTRNEMIIDEQIIYNIICVQLVREDEEVGKFDEVIHQQKVEQCMEECENGNTFFLQTLAYKRLVDLSTMSPERWNEYLAESKRVKKLWEAKIRSL